MDSIAELIVMIVDVGMSDKALFVMDMPESCDECKFYHVGRDMVTGEIYRSCQITPTMDIQDKHIKPDWCPLKPVPEKKKIDEYFYPNFDYAWNACIDEILKGDNDE